MCKASLGFLALYALATIGGLSAQHDPHWWGNRNTMVHLFEWKWDDIAEECEDFLGPRGFAGVQVSPVSENVIVENRPWWERYQPLSYKLETRSGTEEEFADMVRRCNDVGVRIYVDVILNHMAADQFHTAYGTAGTVAEPGEKKFPTVPYSERDFHPTCEINDWNDRWEIQNCELVGLKDLDQGEVWVRDHLVEFLDHLVELGVAGFRVDAAKHMRADHLKTIYERVSYLNTDHGFPHNARAFIYQEVIDYGHDVVSKFEYSDMGAVTEFAYSQEIGNAFRGNNKLMWLRTFGEEWDFLPSKSAFVFVDNHDNQRDGGVVLTYKDAKQYKMATAFKLAHPYGITRIMSSFDFEDHDSAAPSNPDGSIESPVFDDDGACVNGWICEHRWRQIYNMIAFKNVVRDTDVENWWDNDNDQIAFSRGNKGFIAFNGDDHDLRQTLQTGLPPGTYCDIISGDLIDDSCSGKQVVVEDWGYAYVELGNNEFDGVLALHVDAKLD